MQKDIKETRKNLLRRKRKKKEDQISIKMNPRRPKSCPILVSFFFESPTHDENETKMKLGLDVHSQDLARPLEMQQMKPIDFPRRKDYH